jgi:hypothetical protein
MWIRLMAIACSLRRTSNVVYLFIYQSDLQYRGIKKGMNIGRNRSSIRSLVERITSRSHVLSIIKEQYTRSLVERINSRSHVLSIIKEQYYTPC